MYGTLVDWRAYDVARGFTASTSADDDDATAALTRASDYIQYRYVANLLPAYDETLEVVEYGAYEAARLELATPGFFSKTFTPSQQKVLTGVNGIRWTSVGGDKTKIYGQMPVSTIIEAMFEPYITDRNRPGFFMEAVGL